MSKLSLREIAQSQLDSTPVIDGQLIVCLDTGNAYRDTATAHVKIGSDLEVVSDLPLAPLAEKIYYLKPDKLYVFLGGNWTLLNDKTIDLDKVIAKLPAGSSTALNDDVEIITQDTDTTRSHYYRRKLVVLWEYIKTKAQDFFAAKNHKHGKADITDFPTSMPASDVHPWAKAATKPSYTKAEVGLGKVDNTADADKTVKRATTAGTADSANSVAWGNVKNKPATFPVEAHTHDDRYYTEAEVNGKLGSKVDNTEAGANGLFSKLGAWTANPTDNTYFIRQDTGGTNQFGRVKFSTIWNYIRGKTDSIYQPKGNYSTTDTKNTAGSTNTTSKLYLIGATSQSANPQTYSNASVYTTGGALAADGIGKDGYIAYPSGGFFFTQNSTITGYCKIILPVGYTSTMMSFTVTIYDYVSNESVDYKISGYNYGGNKNWYNTTAVCVGKAGASHSNLTVRFGDNGSSVVISIGESTTRWDYPQVVVHDVLLGFNYYSFNSFKSGWSIVFNKQDTPNVSQTISNTHVGYNAITSWDKIQNKPSSFTPASHTHDDRYYTESEMNRKLNEKLSLGGGTMTGPIKFNSSSLPRRASHDFIVGIDAFDAGGTLKWAASSDVKVGSATTADKANSLSGLFSRSSQSWGVQTGTFVHGENDSTGGSFAFRRDCPIGGQMSMVIDGRFYQNEGQYRVLDTSDEKNLNVQSANFAKETYISQYKTVNLTDLDQNTWYPVTGTGISYRGLRHFKCNVQLNSGSKPNWSTHGSGFTAVVDILEESSGWGTTDMQGMVLVNNQCWINDSNKPPVGYRQLNNGSIPVWWLRGGGTYFLAADYDCTWTIRKSKYENSGQSVEPRTTYPGVSVRRSTIVANLDGHANTSEVATVGVRDYNNANNIIKIGWSGADLDANTLSYVAGYTSDMKIHTASKDGVRSWLGLGNAAYKKIQSLSAVGHSNWQNQSTDDGYVPTMAFMAFWNGAFNGSGNSNLQYCNRGRFGTIVTKSSGDYAAAGHIHLNGTKSGAIDWNTITTYGVYKIQNCTMTDTYHAPSGEYQFGILQVLDSENNVGEKRILQIYWPHDISRGNHVWYRMHNSSDITAGWSRWTAIKKKPDSAGTADSATTSNGVKDYNDGNRTIKIGFAGSGLNTSNLTHIAGYTDNGTKIKDVSKDVLTSWIGLGNYLPLSGGIITGQIKKDTGGSWIGDRDRAVVRSHYPGDWSYGAVAGMPTKNGFWTMGALGGWEDLVFNYSTDSNYSASKNETSQVRLPAQAGTIITSATIGSQSVNYANSAGGVAWGNVSGKPSTYTPSSHTHTKGQVGLGNVDNTADKDKSVKYATSAGSSSTATTAAKLGRSGNTGVPMTFNWSGQGGQPTWLWGGNDSSNMYVYNPSNFSVNYANSAGNGVETSGTDYIRFSNGLQICWGDKSSGSSSGVNVFFPVPFSATPPYIGFGSITATQFTPYLKLRSNTFFTWYKEGTTFGKVCWVAIGKWK